MCNSNFTNLLWFIVTSEILPLMYTIHLQMYIHKNLQKCQCPHTHLKFIWTHGILYNFIYSCETIHIICWMVSTTRPAILHHHSDTSTFPHTYKWRHCSSTYCCFATPNTYRWVDIAQSGADQSHSNMNEVH